MSFIVDDEDYYRWQNLAKENERLTKLLDHAKVDYTRCAQAVDVHCATIGRLQGEINYQRKEIESAREGWRNAAENANYPLRLEVSKLRDQLAERKLVAASDTIAERDRARAAEQAMQSKLARVQNAYAKERQQYEDRLVKAATFHRQPYQTRPSSTIAACFACDKKMRDTQEINDVLRETQKRDAQTIADLRRSAVQACDACAKAAAEAITKAKAAQQLAESERDTAKGIATGAQGAAAKMMAERDSMTRSCDEARMRASGWIGWTCSPQGVEIERITKLRGTAAVLEVLEAGDPSCFARELRAVKSELLLIRGERERYAQQLNAIRGILDRL